MSIQVENNLKNSDNSKVFEQKAHYIPCKIEADSAANVEKYFEPFIVEKDNGELSGTFRGHPLDGVKMSLPEGYRAVLVTEAKKPLADDADRRFQVAGGFKEFINWNWDKKPSKNDNIVKGFDWIDIAEAEMVHISPMVYSYLRLRFVDLNHEAIDASVIEFAETGAEVLEALVLFYSLPIHLRLRPRRF